MSLTHYPQLKFTPIKEIVLSISYDGSVELNEIDTFSSEDIIKNTFSEVNNEHGIKIEIRENDSLVSNSNFNGKVFKTSDGSKVLQAKVGIFSLHIINKYEAMSDLISEFTMLWNLFIKHTNNLTPTNIGARYMNFIDCDKSESINDYLKIQTIHPFDTNTDTVCYLKFEEKNCSINVTCAKGALNEEEYGILLDNHIQKNITAVNNINSDFSILQEIKNEIFFKSISNKTLNKYQHENN